jgi:hypothetical protein
MSEKSRNIIFTLCVSATIVTLGLNLFIVRLVDDAFNTLRNEASKAQQVMIAQDYATQVTTIAEYETIRAHELEEQLNTLAEQYVVESQRSLKLSFQLEMQELSIQSQTAYLDQLIEYIEKNKLPIPAPDLGRVPALSEDIPLEKL